MPFVFKMADLCNTDVLQQKIGSTLKCDIIANVLEKQNINEPLRLCIRTFDLWGVVPLRKSSGYKVASALTVPFTC